MNEAQKFQHILNGIREDLAIVEQLYWILHEKLLSNPDLESDFNHSRTVLEIIEWTNDVFQDKVYEINSKVRKFLTDLSLEDRHRKVSIQEMNKYVRDILQEKEGLGRGNTYLNLDKLKTAISCYRYSFDTTMLDVRELLYETDWTDMRNINIEDYALFKRRKYVTAREELEWAKQAIKERKYEGILIHIRAAIDLAIKERFGFKKIRMWQFLNDAGDIGFPLPSYGMVYYFYDEGSDRLHSGKLNTPLECRQALEFANSFIEELELCDISQEQIDNFRKECKGVE